MADDDLDFSETTSCTSQSQGVRKNISLKLKGKGEGRGKKGSKQRRSAPAKKSNVISGLEPIAEDPTCNTSSTKPDSSNLDEVISKLETPGFNAIDRAFPEPLHQNSKLHWNHKVNLIAEKVINPMIHCCEKCTLPILNYGRLAPCRHAFCYSCAKKASDTCPKCNDAVQKVEQAALGTVFMCTFGSARHGPVLCGRTYLSHRDLQAHVNHRHLKPQAVSSSAASSVADVLTSSEKAHHISRDPRDPRGHGHDSLPPQAAMIQHLHSHSDQSEHNRSPAMGSSPAGQQRQYPHSPANYSSSIPVSSARPNLITVLIQDDSQHHTPQYTPSNIPHAMPPIQHPPTAYPPPMPFQHPLSTPSQGYSQAPPITTQTFSQPPVHHPPPPICASGSMYSGPPPPVHHPPPTAYNTPPQGVPPPMTPCGLPQRFSSAGSYEDNAYLPPWNSGAPPSARGGLPPPPSRPITAPPPAPGHNMGHMPPRGPSESAYRMY